MNIKRKLGIYTLLFITATVIIIYFIILPTIKDIKKISDDVYTERVDLEKKYLRGQLLRKTIEDFEKIKPEKDKLTSVFIIEGEELNFITDLEKIASSYDLEQNLDLQPNKNEINGFYYSLPLEIKIQGGFIEILKYLHDLDKLNYYINLSSITINTDTGGQKNNSTLKGEAYILPAEEKE